MSPLTTLTSALLVATHCVAAALGLAPDGTAYTPSLWQWPGLHNQRWPQSNSSDSQSRDPQHQHQATVPLWSKGHDSKRVAMFTHSPQAHLEHGDAGAERGGAHHGLHACLKPYDMCSLMPPTSPTNTTHPRLSAGPSLALAPGKLWLLLLGTIVP